MSINNRTKTDYTLFAPDGKTLGVAAAGQVKVFTALLSGAKDETYTLKDPAGKTFKQLQITPVIVKTSDGSPVSFTFK